jgi:hypothetical protein
MFVIALCGVCLGFAGMFSGSNTVWKIGILLASPLYLLVLVLFAGMASLLMADEELPEAEAESWGRLLLAWFAFFGTKAGAVLLAYGWWQAAFEAPEQRIRPEYSSAFLFHLSNSMVWLGMILGLFFVCGLSRPQFEHRLFCGLNRVSGKITFWAVLLAGIGMYVQVVDEIPW